MLTYSQSTGHLKRDGALIGLGYSGNGLGLFNPSMDNVSNIGPIPQGGYTLIAVFSGHLGGNVFSLKPEDATQMHGRYGMMIHYDNPTKPPFSASEGCIVLTTPASFTLLKDGDALEVIA